jgi:hypothetical protein
VPWEIKESDGKYCVHKAGESDPLKCYPDKAGAEAYMKALYANMPEMHAISDFDFHDDYMALRPGDPFRLLPFGVLIKNGKRREITPEYAATFKLPHFKPPIKLGSHDDPTPAGGHILRLEVRADGLYAIPELNDKGAQAIADGAYRYQSPEVVWEGELEDPTTGEPIKGPLIVGDALLHTPHLGEAAALYSIEPFTNGGNTMPEDTINIPVTLWDKLKAAIHIGGAETIVNNVAEPPAPVVIAETEEFKAAIAERDEFKAKYEAQQAESAKKARIDKYTAAVKETKAEQKAELLASMTDEQADWVVSQFKALSAQIAANDALTHAVGTENENDLSADPEVSIDAQVKALAAEKKVNYGAALQMFAAAHPDLFQSKEK